MGVEYSEIPLVNELDVDFNAIPKFIKAKYQNGYNSTFKRVQLEKFSNHWKTLKRL